MSLNKITNVVSAYMSSLIIIPCILLAGVLTYDVINSFKNMNDAYEAEYNAFLSHGMLSVVHEVQKERGLTAGFIGSEGKQFSNQLKEQRAHTDEALKELKTEVQNWSLSAKMQDVYHSFVDELERRSSVRNSISALQMNLASALKYYTDINNIGLHGVITASKRSHNPIISIELFAIYNFASTKESAGIERAVLSNVLAQDSFSPALRAKHVTLMAKQDVYMQEALEAAPKVMHELFNEVNNSDASQEVEKYRKAVSNKDSDFGLNSKDWFAAATKRINLLKEAEEEALTLVDNTAIKIQQHSVNVLIVEVAIMIIGIVITLALFATIRLRHKQSQEIGEVIEYIVKNKDLTKPIQQMSNDELGDAAVKINHIIKSFREDFTNFSQSSKAISSSTHETAVAIEQSQRNLVEQQANVETIASAAEQMSVNVSVISNAMKENSELVSLVVHESQQGKKSVSEAVEVIELAAAEMSKSADSIDNLNQRVGNISGMVDMIKSIAEQTNLLALNAAIEAARAGEQGRGFAVVADEVRSLAQRTQMSTEEISNVVTELQDSADTAYSVINKGRDNAIQAADRAANIERTLDSITEQVESVQNVTDTVSSNTSDQSSAIQEVNLNIRNIFEQAGENVTGAQKVSTCTNDIASAVYEMDEKIATYKLG